MAFIQQIDESDATGHLKQIYDAAIQRAGSVAGIIKLMSLDANIVDASMKFYLTLMKSPNALEPATKELLATVVSNTNNCFY
jgi:alkylhydroperoxidase family enzyme